MPFVQVIWSARRFMPSQLARIGDELQRSVATAFMHGDPDNIVTPAMVDVRFLEIGPLDRIRSDLFVTVLARWQPLRSDGAGNFVAHVNASLVGVSGYADAVTELVLTNQHSSFDYSQLE